MQIILNGQPREFEQGQTVADLLSVLGRESRQVAVEVNQRLVPRGEHPDCRLQAGDRIEVVTLVGGG